MFAILLRILVIVLVLVGGPLPAVGAADTPPPDVAARAAQLRALMATDQGAAMLDLLGDSSVRAMVLQDAGPVAASPATDQPSAGRMMDDTLRRLRARLWDMGVALDQAPAHIARAWEQARAQLPGSQLPRLFGAVVVFVAGGIAAELLLLRLARSWRAHFNGLALATPRQRLSVQCERLAFSILLILVSAAGSMGAF